MSGQERGASSTGTSQHVVAVGIDTADVSSVAASLERYHDRYLRFVLSPAERAETPPEPAAVATRWAAKEAVAKVLGPSADDVWPWPSIEVLGLDGPTPRVRLRDRAHELALARGIDELVVRCRPDLPGASPASAVTVTAVGLSTAASAPSTREKDS